MALRLLRILMLPLAMMAAVPTLAQPAYWQCAAFARQFSGIEIRGDAWTWWGLAEGRYAKGRHPRIGAVLSFTPSGSMRLGHVATVTRLLGDREIMVTHANWSPIGGIRGQVERDVVVRDVSAAGDWSRVRVWYAPIGDLGTTAWPVDGFIYPGSTNPGSMYATSAPRRSPEVVVASALSRPAPFRPASSSRALPRLAYTPVDQLIVGAPAGPRLRLGSDIMRLAMLETRQRP